MSEISSCSKKIVRDLGINNITTCLLVNGYK